MKNLTALGIELNFSRKFSKYRFPFSLPPSSASLCPTKTFSNISSGFLTSCLRRSAISALHPLKGILSVIRIPGTHCANPALTDTLISVQCKNGGVQWKNAGDILKNSSAKPYDCWMKGISQFQRLRWNWEWNEHCCTADGISLIIKARRLFGGPEKLKKISLIKAELNFLNGLKLSKAIEAEFIAVKETSLKKETSRTRRSRH